MEAFLHPLQGLAEFGEIKKRCGANCGILNVSGCMESQKVHLMYGLSGLFPYHLILADDVYEFFITKLFEEEKDCIELIKIKEIMHELEKSTDAAEHVGKILKSLIVKYA